MRERSRSSSTASSRTGSARGCTNVAKPVVGITTYLTQAAFGVWDLDAALVPADYVRAVTRAGGVPLLVPPSPDASDTLDAFDGLVFSGGSDLDPELYGDQPHEATVGVV